MRRVTIGDAPLKNILRVLRAEHNWSQQELGLRVGVSRQAINAIETGKFDPSLPLAMKMARVFKMPIENIFELEEGD
jgi:putative transcriptional regulator